MRLRPSQLGETATAKSSGRSGGRRLPGALGAFVHRAEGEAVAAAQTLLVKHGVAGPSPPSFEALCAAMHAVRHRVLRKTHVLTMAPLVMIECEDEARERTAPPRTADAGALLLPAPEPDRPLRVVMQRPTFDRACGNGERFVVFGPFLEVRGGSLLLVAHAEALPYPALMPHAHLAAGLAQQFAEDRMQDADATPGLASR